MPTPTDPTEPTERDLELAAPHVWHYTCEGDSWWSCPESSEGCADERQSGCNCGYAEKRRAVATTISKARREGRVEGLREGAQIIRHEPHTCMTEGHCDELHQVQRDAAERCEARAAELEATDE